MARATHMAPGVARSLPGGARAGTQRCTSPRPGVRCMNVKGRLPNSEHPSRPWRIHEIAADFRLEDVWALPVRGEKGDFLALVNGFAAGDPSRSSRLTRA